MRSWPQTIALVTGASRGIGRALAALLAERGARVWACARSQPLLEELAQTYPAHIIPVVADLRDEAQVAALMQRVMAQHGRLDVLIHNASVLGPLGPLAQLQAQDWRQTLAANLDASFFVLKHADEALRRGAQAQPTQGSLALLVSSSVGRRGRGGWGAYSVSKCGLEGLAQIAHDELSQAGVCCVTVNPGGTATQMRALAYPNEDPTTLPSPEEVAATFLLLAGALTPAQSGRRYSSRALGPWVQRLGASLDADSLPHDP